MAACHAVDTGSNPVDSVKRGKCRFESGRVHCYSLNQGVDNGRLVLWYARPLVLMLGYISWLDSLSDKQKVGGSSPPPSTLYAVVAQLVEHLVANEKVTGSNPVYCLNDSGLPGTRDRKIQGMIGRG
jgi:hypothetical protein